MEWRVAGEDETRSVVVPEGLDVSVIQLLQSTGLALDLYGDRALGREGTGRALEALREVRVSRRRGAEEGIRRELRTHTLPRWAGDMVEARLQQDELAMLCSALIELCEQALSRNLPVEVIGQ